MQPINRAADSHEIRPLTGIRGVAALLVILGHFYKSWFLLFPQLRPYLLPLALHGALGVDLFFVLSGFILSYVYPAARKHFGLADYGRFIWFRLARIYPNHLATLAALGVILAAANHFGFSFPGDYPLNALPYQLTMTHAWIVVHDTHWNYPSWSISAEWFAYLLIFPACWRLLRCRLNGAIFFALAYAFLIPYSLFSASVAHMRHDALIRVGCEFIAGSALFGAYTGSGLIVGLCQRYVSIAFLLLMSALAVLPPGALYGPVPTLMLFPVILLGLTSEKSLVARALSTPLALFLGRVSYALYMSHALAQRILEIVLPSARFAHSTALVRLLVLAANLAVIGVFATGLYHFVELPARNHLRHLAHWWSGGRASAPTKGSAAEA
jgi:peptidoglycan/LPS O-acetylase OafA/YrhL